jgi:hypothetical protein
MISLASYIHIFVKLKVLSGTSSHFRNNLRIGINCCDCGTSLIAIHLVKTLHPTLYHIHPNKTGHYTD